MIELLQSIFDSPTFSHVVYGNTLGKWIVSLLIVIISLSISRLLKWIIKNIISSLVKRTKMKCDDIIIGRIENPLVFSIIIVGFKMAFSLLNLPDNIEDILAKIFIVLITINGTWFLSGIISGLLDEVIKPRLQVESDTSGNVFSIIRKIVIGLIWAFGIVTALNNSGYDVGALIAGLGIGGIAMAMAAQNTVANFFGGVTILLDRPFSIGQRIRISGYDGVVETIGMRTFRLRTLSGTLVTIPNSQITGSVIENVTLEPTRKITIKLGLTYNTTSEQLEKAMELLKTIAIESPNVSDDPKVYFENFGDFSLDIVFIYYIVKNADIYETQSEINLEILRRFTEAKYDFAFPTQTICLEKNT